MNISNMGFFRSIWHLLEDPILLYWMLQIHVWGHGS